MTESRDRGRAISAFALALAVALLAAAVAGCGGGDSPTASVPGCKAVDAPEAKEVSLEAPKQTVKPGERLTAVVQTSCGEFEIALDTKRSPKTVNSFAYLARQGFYDGLDFYKVVSGFAIYAGDPTRDGSGGPGYTVVEKPVADTTYPRGVVAMAKELSEPAGTSGSAFFVATSEETGLPPEYALLGEVSQGYSTVERINDIGTPNEEPKVPVLIEKLTIEKG